jgi:WD40 repeat protein
MIGDTPEDLTRPPHPYVRRHLASHAAAGHILDESVLNPDTLPYLDEARLSGLLRLTEAPPGSGLWAWLGAWRSVRHRWSWDDPDANAAALDLALTAAGFTPPNRRTISGLTWVPLWAAWHTGGTILASERGSPCATFGTVDGRSVVATAVGAEVRLWNAATGQLLGEPLRADAVIDALAMTRGRPQPVVGAVGRAGRLWVWDALTHVCLHAIDVGEGLRAIALGELNGRLVVAVGGIHGYSVELRYVDTGAVCGPSHTGRRLVRSLALDSSPGGAARLCIGTVEGRVEQYRIIGSGSFVDADPRSSDEPPLSYSSAGIRVESEVNAVAFGVLGDRLVIATAGANGIAQVWDALNGQAVTSPLKHGDEVQAVALEEVAGSTLLAAGSLDGFVTVSDASSRQPLHATLPHPAGVNSVAFGNVDGRTMLATACADGNTRLWDPIQSSAARVAMEGRFGSVAVTSSGGEPLVVAAGDTGRVQIWSGEHGRHRQRFAVQQETTIYKFSRHKNIDVAAGTLENRRVVMTSFRGAVELWDIDDPVSGKPTRVALHSARRDPTDQWRPAIIHVSNGHAIATNDLRPDMTEVIDVLTKETLSTIHLREESKPLSFFSSRGRILLALLDQGKLELRDVESGQTWGAPVPVNQWTSHVALGVIDDIEVVAVFEPNQLRLLDVQAGNELVRPIAVPGTKAVGIAFGQTAGRDLLVTAHRATVRIWNPRTGRKLSELPFSTGIDAMSVDQTSDGRLLIGVGGPGVVLVELRDMNALPAHLTNEPEVVKT